MELIVFLLPQHSDSEGGLLLSLSSLWFFTFTFTFYFTLVKSLALFLFQTHVYITVSNSIILISYSNLICYSIIFYTFTFTFYIKSLCVKFYHSYFNVDTFTFTFYYLSSWPANHVPRNACVHPSVRWWNGPDLMDIGDPRIRGCPYHHLKHQKLSWNMFKNQRDYEIISKASWKDSSHLCPIDHLVVPFDGRDHTGKINLWNIIFQANIDAY